MTTANALARIELAEVAREAADLARGVVGDVSTPQVPGELIRAVRRVRMATLAMLDRAVLAELGAGGTWEDVGAALGIDVDTARRRYESTWDAWRAGDPDVVEVFASDAAEKAAALDQWYNRHRDPWDDPEPQQPVARALA